MTAKKMNLTTSQALELVEIARCESLWDQSEHPDNYATSTEGVWEVWSTDWGVYQINDHWWNEYFEKQGLNYKENEDDNIVAGIMMYQQLGAKPWSASKKCWSISKQIGRYRVLR